MAKIWRKPESKINRRFGTLLIGRNEKPNKRKGYPPGQHGSRLKRKKKSQYAIRLMEKQKLKAIYGLNERHLKRFLKIASKRVGNTGTALLQICESLLSNVVYRLGFAPTRKAAAQLVSHRHILVNGKIVNIPTYMVKPNSVIEVREGSRNIPMVVDSISQLPQNCPWLEVNRKEFKGIYLRHPEKEEIPEEININLVLEFFTK